MAESFEDVRQRAVKSAMGGEDVDTAPALTEPPELPEPISPEGDKADSPQLLADLFRRIGGDISDEKMAELLELPVDLFQKALRKALHQGIVPGGQLEPPSHSATALRNRAARAAIDKEHRMDMSSGGTGFRDEGAYWPDRSTPELEPELEPDAAKTSFALPELAQRGPDALGVYSEPGDPAPPYPEPAQREPQVPGIYTAEGDTWTYAVKGDGTYRAKSPDGDWLTILPGEQPEIYAAISEQIDKGVLRSSIQMPAGERIPQALE